MRMSHSLTKIWIHLIFSTKDRAPLINSSIETRVYQYLAEQLRQLGCTPKRINGMPDHVHILFRLTPLKAIADVVKQTKGATAHYINAQNLLTEKFSWQTGYGAFAVSESNVDKVDGYIEAQKEHHRTFTFAQEYDRFLQVHGLSAAG
jgi:REP element-mobilizing transposase RayT